MTINEIIEKSGKSKKALAEYLHIPYMTFFKWCTGERTAPPYVIELIEYKLKNEGLI